MNRAEAAADVLAAVQACLGDECPYRLLMARAITPQECNHITAVWGTAAYSYDSDCGDDGGCGATVDETLTLMLTRVCVRPDAQRSFDFDGEELEAVCFERDIKILEDCIRCGDWRQFRIDHGVDRMRLSESYRDPDVQGGGVTAYIVIKMSVTECC